MSAVQNIDLINVNTEMLDKKSKDSKNEFKYPDCWYNDDARMKVLLLPFRDRDVNPENYDSKMNFWKNIITQYCSHTGSVTFDLNDIESKFTYNHMSPRCLRTVLNNLVREGKIKTRSDYETGIVISWISWTINIFIKWPVQRSWEMVKSGVGLQTGSNSVEYVHLDNVKNFCQNIEKELYALKRGEIVHYDELKDLIHKALNYTNDTIYLCLLTLHAQKKLGIKFKAKTTDIILVKVPSSNNAIDITETEEIWHDLKSVKSTLNKQLETMDAEIITIDAKIKDCIKANNRRHAKTHLRKRHLIERNYEKRSLALANIEAILHNLEEANMNGTIIKAYKIGAETLQKTLEKQGLTYDKVDDVLTNVRDTIDLHNDVQDRMSEPTDSGITIDDDELERELMNIINDDNNDNDNTSGNNATEQSNVVDNNDENKNAFEKAEKTDTSLVELINALEIENKSLEADNTNIDFPNAL